MAERRNLGDILTGIGRLSDEAVAKALEYQRDHGGYFGEALIACGFLSAEELEWGLASQFDLPYVFPDADSIDVEAASLVSAEWALAHLALPITRTEDTLTVVVESPFRTAALDELETRTGLEIELALASPTNIREAIQQVYARGAPAEEGAQQKPVDLESAFREALGAASSAFGVSTRGPRASAWWDDSGTVRRRPLRHGWEAELEQLLEPPPRDRIASSSRATWEATLDRDGVPTPVEVRYLADESGRELLVRPVGERPALEDRFSTPGRGLVSEVRMLARSGSARFIVTTEPSELGHEILPHLPGLLLDPSWRSLHILREDREPPAGVFAFRLPTDPERWTSELEALRAFHFDVVTVDLPGDRADWADRALAVAPVAFFLWPASEQRKIALDAGIRWDLHIVAAEGHRLAWSLEPLPA
jgi:hypothetical protein